MEALDVGRYHLAVIRRVYGSAQRFESEELVFTEKDIRGGRSILRVQAADWTEFFTREEPEKFDELEF